MQDKILPPPLYSSWIIKKCFDSPNDPETGAEALSSAVVLTCFYAPVFPYCCIAFWAIWVWSRPPCTNMQHAKMLKSSIDNDISVLYWYLIYKKESAFRSALSFFLLCPRILWGRVLNTVYDIYTDTLGKRKVSCFTLSKKTVSKGSGEHAAFPSFKVHLTFESNTVGQTQQNQIKRFTHKLKQVILLYTLCVSNTNAKDNQTIDFFLESTKIGISKLSEKSEILKHILIYDGLLEFRTLFHNYVFMNHTMSTWTHVQWAALATVHGVQSWPINYLTYRWIKPATYWSQAKF